MEWSLGILYDLGFLILGMPVYLHLVQPPWEYGAEYMILVADLSLAILKEKDSLSRLCMDNLCQQKPAMKYEAHSSCIVE